jgi:hypothetical protein
MWCLYKEMNIVDMTACLYHMQIRNPEEPTVALVEICRQQAAQAGFEY